MAIKFQFNKTSLGDMNRQLNMRKKALPTIKSKESALRSEVRKAKETASEFDSRLEELTGRYDYMTALWGEFDPDLVKIKDVELDVAKIAGVRTPVLREVVFEVRDYDLFGAPVWLSEGIEIVKRIAELRIGRQVYERKTELLDYARKKTTQKVNLYEKVQIPGYEAAILKIKRFLEDEENLSKSAQKIVKSRQQRQGEEALAQEL